MGAPERPPRKRGLAHLLAALRYSVAGLRRLLRESAFRQELLLGAVLLLALAWRGAGLARMAGLVVLLLLLVAVEALNTAIEELVDQLSPQWSEFARDAKDLGSVAVAALVLASGIYWAWAFFG